MQVKTTQIKDINDRNLNYIVFEKNNKKEVINVGEKTFNKIKTLLDEPEQLQIEETREMEKPHNLRRRGNGGDVNNG